MTRTRLGEPAQVRSSSRPRHARVANVRADALHKATDNTMVTGTVTWP
jgi:hypothetical protein